MTGGKCEPREELRARNTKHSHRATRRISAATDGGEAKENQEIEARTVKS